MKLPRSIKKAAFTLAETMVALGLFGIAAASSVTALIRMNNNAALSRLQTGASTVAQNRIDLILSDMPFNPQKGQVPPQLALGTRIEGTPAAPVVPVYTDPASGEVVVRGWLTSTIANTNTTAGSTALNIYQATVTVNYRYRGRIYSVVMETMRCPDI
ncbi:MAG TPA: hypothetical protein VGO90_07190 [Chthoniobacteraceae bacterium]|jgi:type II secretory pathway pseudopilin PulG|nr:hypothetical protein [Chthoniobacter sp.]HEV7867449.1 hypothetical protein [Chthoniobacteraceae bacterium]